MAHLFPFKIITMNGVAFQSDVASVSLPTEEGEIQVLPDHTPLVSLMRPGEMRIQREDGGSESLAVSGGFVEVRKDGETIILSDTAEHPHEIDLEAAERARVRAEEALKEKDRLSDVDFARFQSMLDHELARINVAIRHGGGERK